MSLPPATENTRTHFIPSSDSSPSFPTETSVAFPFPFPRLQDTTELANHFQESSEKDRSSDRTTGGNDSNDPAVGVVRSFYDALRSNDVDTVHRLLAPDLEWWFHGPPSHQYLMRLLTGSQGRHQTQPSFAFAPDTIASFGKLAIAEGCNKRHSIFWVHAWTVSDDGVITQVREYFNTSLTVTRFGSPEPSSEITPVASDTFLSSVWESSLSDQVGKSVPGLVLAL